MNQNRLQNPLLLGFILLSLALHLLLVFLLPDRSLFPTPPKPDRVVVEMRPSPQELRERELDQPPRPELEKPRETPAKRLGAADQVVEKETAPKGDSPEDMRPDAPAPPVQAVRPKQVAPPAPAATEPRPSETATRAPAEVSPPQPETPTAATTPLPDLKALLELPQTTVARLEDEWRQRYRKDVDEGDVVWLDMEQDLLFSFFQRLRDKIYSVWNYPRPAAERGEAGTCLLRISVLRDGTLQDVVLLESSGFPALDKEALAAVRKGAPYGALPRTYDKDHLNIMAFFRYELNRSTIRRPGSIY